MKGVPNVSSRDSGMLVALSKEFCDDSHIIRRGVRKVLEDPVNSRPNNGQLSPTGQFAY